MLFPTSLLSLLTILLPYLPFPSSQPPPPNALQFHLRQSHTSHPSDPRAGLLLSSSPSSQSLSTASIAPPLVVKTKKVRVYRARNATVWSDARWRGRMKGLGGEVGDMIDWDGVEVDGPDVEDRETLLALAQMTSNAYTLPSDTSGWIPIDGYNTSIPIGWDSNADRMRGHIFANDDNSTVIIAIKGTSAGLLGSGGPTAKNDRFNDNLLLCCCARVDFSWSTVCDCFAGGMKCHQTCVEKALIEESVYYPIGTNLYNNISTLYPNANIWLTGHSLGGAISSLLGVTFGAPTVAFESPGDRLAAGRLHLPLPPAGGDGGGITHVYNTADPIAMGSCTGTLSTCYAAGFAMEARCHLGKSIVYDTVNKLGWYVDIRSHRIGVLTDILLTEDWNDGEGKKHKQPNETETSSSLSHTLSSARTSESGKDRRRRGVPRAEEEVDCVDCFKWEFGDDFGKKSC